MFFLLLVSLLGCRQSSSSAPAAAGFKIQECGGAGVHLAAAAGGGPPALRHAPASVVIVGGGLAGLVTAYELEKRGISTHILEATELWGGRVATAEYAGGAIAEYGMQEIWGDNPLLRILTELGLPLDSNPVQPYSSVVLDGKLYPYFRGTKEAYFDTLMTQGERERFVTWLDQANKLREQAEKEGLGDPQVRSLQSISLAAWVESANLPKNAAELVRLLTECELATSWHGVSALFGLLEFGAFLGEGRLAEHVRGGNSRLVDAIVRALRGEKTLSALVTRVERRQSEDGRITVRVHYQQSRRSHTVDAERVVIAVPFWRLHQIEMVPPLSDEKWQAIFTLGRGQYTVVHLNLAEDAQKLWMIDGKAPFAVLTDGPLGVIYGVSGESSPPATMQVFSLLIHGQAAAAFHMVPRAMRLKEVFTHLDRLWPSLSSRVQGSYVYTYHPGAVPVWPPGRSPLDELSQKLREPERGLYLAGDYLYNAHSDGAVRSGMRAAERIAAELRVRP